MFLLCPPSTLFLVLFFGATLEISEYGQKMFSRSYCPGEDNIKMSKRSYIRYASKNYWKPKGQRGWFLRTIHPTNKGYPVAKEPADNPRKSLTSAGFGVSYGRGGVSYGRG